MKRFIIVIFGILVSSIICYCQNNYQRGNQTNIIINNQPVIEKKEYIIKYRPVYVEKPLPKRHARRLPAPICLLNYLWIYPEDLGTYANDPWEIIRQINNQCQYGRNDWRVPTSDELRLMENYANECGLGDDIYLSTSHRNGILRLVSSGKSVQEQQIHAHNEQLRQEAQRQAQEAASLQSAINNQKHLILTKEVLLIDNLLWDSRNVGARDIFAKGTAYEVKPSKEGWRLPTANEFLKLTKQSTEYNGYFMHDSGLIIPYGTYSITFSNGEEGTIILPGMMVNDKKTMPTLFRLVQDKIY